MMYLVYFRKEFWLEIIEFLWPQVVNPLVPYVTLCFYLISFIINSNSKKEKHLTGESLPEIIDFLHSLCMEDPQEVEYPDWAPKSHIKVTLHPCLLQSVFMWLFLAGAYHTSC